MFGSRRSTGGWRPLFREAIPPRTARRWFRSRHASENPGQWRAAQTTDDGQPATSRVPSPSSHRTARVQIAFQRPFRLSLRRLREGRENSRPGADALVEALQVVFLVRRMDVVVVEAEADQHGVEAERALEIGHDRDRARPSRSAAPPCPTPPSARAWRRRAASCSSRARSPGRWNGR